VGGGFGRAGLHSVLEPAAWSLPVTFGPRWHDSRDAALLLAARAAVALPAEERDAILALQEQWERWIADPAGRETEGRRARQVVDEGVGAADRSAAMLHELISG
jgi:3-deoxy-D-manno-octulosonic-acid transferase